MKLSLTDTKQKRLGVIIAVVIAVVASVAYFNVQGTNLANSKAAQVEEAANELATSATYEEVNTFVVEDFFLHGVRPYAVGNAAGDFIVKWKVEKWGAGRCITAVWTPRDAPSVTRIDC